MLANYIASINAFAGLLFPVDPLFAQVWPGTQDYAAGALSKTLGPGIEEAFGVEVVRFFELAEQGALAASGLYVQEGLGKITTTQGEDFFAELDAQAQAAGPYQTFAGWAAADAVAAGALIASIQAGTAVPITLANSAAAFTTLYVPSARICALVYYQNYPNNNVRNNLIGFGPDHEAQPVYSDANWKIANPNQRTIGQGGVATDGTAWNYRAYPWPPRIELVQAHEAALLDWHLPASEAAYNALVTAYADGSAIAL